MVSIKINNKIGTNKCKNVPDSLFDEFKKYIDKVAMSDTTKKSIEIRLNDGIKAVNGKDFGEIEVDIELVDSWREWKEKYEKERPLELPKETDEKYQYEFNNYNANTIRTNNKNKFKIVFFWYTKLQTQAMNEDSIARITKHGLIHVEVLSMSNHGMGLEFNENDDSDWKEQPGNKHPEEHNKRFSDEVKRLTWHA